MTEVVVYPFMCEYDSYEAKITVLAPPLLLRVVYLVEFESCLYIPPLSPVGLWLCNSTPAPPSRARIKKPGATTMTAVIKGLVEVILFSYHEIPVILMSALQGLLPDAIIYILGYRDLAFYLGCGIASASNVAFLQFILLLPFPASVFSFMYLLAFVSGTVFGGYSGILLHKMVEIRIERADS